ncbi:MAG: hypothetical protein Q7U82_06450, partial [Gammaproteobacteria bacterium]|nr:hypothetical protein [Gammaproteobacteria bacterium]
KVLSADGSVGFPHVRVGHRQAFKYTSPNQISGWGFVVFGPCEYREHTSYETPDKVGCALGEQRLRRMTALREHKIIIELIQEAVQSGARQHNPCAEVQIGLRTYRRWYQAGNVQPDQRPEANRSVPINKPSE